jgi:hypothetical protein
LLRLENRGFEKFSRAKTVKPSKFLDGFGMDFYHIDVTD